MARLGKEGFSRDVQPLPTGRPSNLFSCLLLASKCPDVRHTAHIGRARNHLALLSLARSPFKDKPGHETAKHWVNYVGFFCASPFGPYPIPRTLLEKPVKLAKQS